MAFDFKSIGKALAGAGLPLLGTAILGPAGGAIGGMIAGKLGLGPNASDTDLVSMLGDPATIAKLKELELENEVELEKLAIESERIHLADTADARDREANIVKATGKLDYNLYILAWVIVAGFFGLTAALVFVAVPKGSTQAVFMLFGALSAGFGQVIQYFFGSSKSSAEKTALMNGK